MTDPTPDEFARRVRGLDPETLTRFVADLYAARGFDAEVTGDGRFAATMPGDGEVRTVRVATSLPSEPVPEHTLVVPRRTDVGSVGDAEVVDVRALSRMALYAIERERLAALSAEYFDGDWGAETAADEAGAGDGIRAGGWAPVGLPGGAPTPGLAALFAVSLVVLAAVVTGVNDGPTAGPGIERTVTPVPVSTEQTGATPTAVLGPEEAAACPAPPADAHPASFRPVPVDAALSSGLESWEYRLGVNSSVFYGPSPLQIRWTPQIRHESTYRTPEGEDIVLTIDRWNSSTAAAEAGRALALEYGLAAAWGRYTLTVTYNSAPANTSVERTAARATSRLLLSQVATPGGGKLGRECLETILFERPA